MGLASALSTALTGMKGAETTIDVVGNNLANSSTVGFKASQVQFASQFMLTQSLGSGPTSTSGGTNPRQVGLGSQVSQITPNFTQGTIQVSSSPSDLAIQDDGFFIVQGTDSQTLYTRNGIFKTNSQNQLVTITGNRLLGYGVDSNFHIETTALKPLAIPLGAQAVAQATQNVYFQGTLTPTGDLANQAQIVQSGILGDSQYEAPAAGTTNNLALPPVVGSMTGAASGAGTFAAGSYNYKIVFVDGSGNETDASTVNVNVAAGGAGVNLTSLPTDSSGAYVGRRIYRSQELGSLPSGVAPSYYLVKDLATDNTSTSLAASAAGIDSTSDATLVTQQAEDLSSISGNYSYFVTYYKPGVGESRPSPLIGPRNVTDGRIVLSDFPAASDDYAGGQVRIYRNLSTQPDQFYRVAQVDPSDSYIDYRSDAAISNASDPDYGILDRDGPKIGVNSLVVDMTRRDGTTYEHVFKEGTLAFTGKKGERSVGEKTFTITSTTTVQELIDFMQHSLGIQTADMDPQNPVPGDVSGVAAGGSVLTNGVLQFVSNNGVDNGVTIPLSSFVLTDANGQVTNPNVGFGVTQEGKGQSAVSDFIVYDSLGIPLNVRVTVNMESRDSTSTIYRWYADSPDNQPLDGVGTSVGTGLITFDGEGNVVSVSQDTVSIERREVSSVSPLEFKLNLDSLSGLAASKSSLAASRQDGSTAGTLSSYIIGEDGVIRGVFSNGVTRDLGQIVLAKFGNPAGLEQRGENMYAEGVNSGLPVKGSPGQNGIGTIVAGAVELSNTDIGRNLIDLILASTQYRGNSRVITTTQSLFEELLALNR